MSDTFNVTASFDKPSYAPGDIMTLKISGNATRTVTNTGTLSGEIDVAAADGATEVIPLPAVTIPITTTTPQTVRMTGIKDSGGRTWTISADGLSATAVA